MDKRVKRVFLDTNIVMDAIERRAFRAEAETILGLCRQECIEGFVATMSFATMAYLLRRCEKNFIYDTFARLTEVLKVASVTTEQFSKAMQFGAVRDFEDMLQYQCAIANGCDVIVTNNIRDYLEFSQIPVMTSRDFLLQYFRSH